MKCPKCDAAMDLNAAGTWNAWWECPFDGQIENVNPLMYTDSDRGFDTWAGMGG